MVEIVRQKKLTQYLSFCRFRQMANVGGEGLLSCIFTVAFRIWFIILNNSFTEAGFWHLNGGSPSLGESTFLSLSSPTIFCLAIADRAKLNCRHRDIGFDPNSCLAFVKFFTKCRRMEAKREI